MHDRGSLVFPKENSKTKMCNNRLIIFQFIWIDYVYSNILIAVELVTRTLIKMYINQNNGNYVYYHHYSEI